MKPNMICEVCGKAVNEKQGDMGWGWFINAAIVGQGITLRGHKACCENVNRKVVIPQRIAMMMRRERE